MGKDTAFGLLNAHLCQCSALAEQLQALAHSPLRPPECSSPWSPGRWPSMEHPHGAVTAASMQEGTSRHHRVQTTFGSTALMKSQLYLFLLFSVYLLCFPVHKLFFTSFLKELLFNSIPGINYCITLPRDPLEQ